MDKEVILPKSIRQEHPEWFEHETILGYPKGSQRQYRYGNLHIREYKDHITIHQDVFDPRIDPLGHLIHDAPELLVGTACGTVAGGLTYRYAKNITGSTMVGALAGLAAGLAAFAAGKYAVDKLGEA